MGLEISGNTLESLEYQAKLKMCIPYDSAIPLLGTYPTEALVNVPQELLKVVHEVLLRIVKSWKQMSIKKE